ncbi:MAG: GmrSD restriction endonuclease domain-containing protein [Pyrinomonadaceae bacterium]
MSFNAITVKEAIKNIRLRKYVLPSIQRELVWKPDKIKRLFDSLMRDYPISSFLFWQLDRSKIEEFTFYEFIKDYHERDKKHNEKTDDFGEGEIYGILDGQQRLTSLYIGLCGSYSHKEHRYRWHNDNAFPQRFLYLNILREKTAKDDDDEIVEAESELELKYDFRFLTDVEAKAKNDEENYWFKVKDILGFEGLRAINPYLMERLANSSVEKYSFASDVLSILYEVVHIKEIINHYVEKSDKLDKVLNIFVRINSGGETLSYSDLLLSIASARWETDARKEITKFVDEVNKIRDGFNFNKDFVLKSCLVLCDFSDVAFKVNNFNRRNMKIIEENWQKIKTAIRLAVELVASFDYNRERLISNNALIPIAYYLLKKGLPQSFVESKQYQEDRERIKKWLIASLLKQAFSGQPDSVIRPIRTIIQQNHVNFPLAEIVQEFNGKPKDISVNDDYLENLLDYNYGNKYVFTILSVLYPHLDFRNRFHIDHIYPQSFFKKKDLIEKGVSEEKLDFYLENYNSLANLQLLERTPNTEKSNKEFKEWLVENCSDEQSRRDFLEKNFIPDIDLSLLNFEEFIEKRTELMRKKFKNLLQL